MTDIELLPLPVRNYVDGDGLWETATGPYSAEETQAYARANMEPLLAEIETLRNQRDFLVAEYERAVDCGEQGYTHAAMHLFNAIANAQADENTKTIMALRVEVNRLQEEIDNRWARGVHTCHDNCQRTACVLRRDNERLVEALREVAELTEAEGDALSVARSIARNVLRGYDQENK